MADADVHAAVSHFNVGHLDRLTGLLVDAGNVAVLKNRRAYQTVGRRRAPKLNADEFHAAIFGGDHLFAEKTGKIETRMPPRSVGDILIRHVASCAPARRDEPLSVP